MEESIDINRTVSPANEDELEHNKITDVADCKVNVECTSKSTVTWSAVYNRPARELEPEKPSVCVRSFKNITINNKTAAFDTKEFLKPRTIYYVKKSQVNDQSCLEIQSKTAHDGGKCGNHSEDKHLGLLNNAKSDSEPEVTITNEVVALPINNGMQSLLRAFESTEGISNIFQFPTDSVAAITEHDHAYSRKQTTMVRKTKRKRTENIISNKGCNVRRGKMGGDTNSALTEDERNICKGFFVCNKRKRKRKRRTFAKGTNPVSKYDTPIDELLGTLSKDKIIDDKEKFEMYSCPEMEILEYLFKFAHFPGSKYMDTLAKQLRISWKLVNSWFINRRREGKKNGMSFKIKAFSQCTYCDHFNPEMEASIDHLISKSHIDNVKNAFYLRVEEYNKLGDLSQNVKPANLSTISEVPSEDEIVPVDNIDDFVNDAYTHISKKCTICGSCFPNQWSLLRHSITHRYIICGMCNVEVNESIYQKHVASHLSENMKDKLWKHCMCVKCDQLECTCEIPVPSLLNDYGNDCRCRSCRKLGNELQLLRLSRHEIEDKNFVKPFSPYDSLYSDKCQVCHKDECECREFTSSPRYGKILDRTRNLFNQWSNPSKNILKLWTAAKEQEDNGLTEITLPDRNSANTVTGLPVLVGSSYIKGIHKSDFNVCNNSVGEFFSAHHEFQLDSNYGKEIFEEMPDSTDTRYRNKKDFGNGINMINFHSGASVNCSSEQEKSNSKLEPSFDPGYLKCNCVKEYDKKSTLSSEHVNSFVFQEDTLNNYCILCGADELDPRSLLLHTKKHLDKRTFICTCGIHLCNFRECVEHVFEHLFISPYVCKFCYCKFPKHQDIIKHLLTIHSYTSIDEMTSYNWIPSESPLEEHNDNLVGKDQELYNISENEAAYNTMDNNDEPVEDMFIRDNEVLELRADGNGNTTLAVSNSDFVQNLTIHNDNVKTEIDNEEFLDLDEIPDNIEDLGGIFETVLLTDKT